MCASLSSNLVMVGPMGAGKTTIGRRLARSLGRDFIDSDQEIERRTGVDIPLIFELEGEAGFRAREKKIIADLCQQTGIVLATGGGAVLDSDNRQRLAGSGYVIYLRTTVDEQLRRIRNDNNRPLLQTDNPRARLEGLLEIRDPLYRDVADIVVDTEKGYVRQSINRILKQYRQQPGCRSR